MNEQIDLKSNKFLKLESEIEMIDMALPQLMDQQSELLQKCLNNWIISEKYFKVLKFIDNCQHSIELVKSQEMFTIYQTENQVQYLFCNKFKQFTSKSEKCSINNHQITFIIKYSALMNVENENFVNLMKIMNCVFPQNTITFKSIPYKILNQLLDCQFQTYEINEVILKMLNLMDMIFWKDIEHLELLSTYIPQSELYMYHSPQEYFDIPNINVYEQFLNGHQCIIQKKGDFEFHCIINMEFKNTFILSKSKNKLISDQLKVIELLTQYCKPTQSMIIIVQSDSFDLQELEQICKQNPKLLRSHQFKGESQQNHFLIEQISLLYLSMQNDLSEIFASQQNKELIHQQFKNLLFNKYVIEKL